MDWTAIYMILCVNSYIVFGKYHGERIYFPGEIREVTSPSNLGGIRKVTFPPEEIRSVTPLPSLEQIREVASPSFFSCGNTFMRPPKAGLIETRNGKEEEYPYYHLNQTAEELASQGFQIIVHEVLFGDVLTNFSYSNATCEGNIAFHDFLSTIVVVGGEDSMIQRSYYMAQIGEKRGTLITWLCDGVLINSRWILSAAHCFAKPGVNPNVVRLGDYDLSSPWEPLPVYSTYKEFIRDYPIHQLILHPEFKVGERYHDLVLIQIPRKIPQQAHNFMPVCLPWDSETNKNLVETDVTLTGWGATQYGGSKTTILQEVTLKVFNNSVCAQAYANLPDSKQKYPDGITNDKILCVGWEEDGKDACGGDSGAPVVYEGRGGYKLAGIVSAGYGCGLKQYPGLYTPINNPKYLQWIKDVAFNDEGGATSTTEHFPDYDNYDY